ncbi:hypothetical protein Slala02_45210 [Streptomyces lavendulae subsp. lavendulae]|nr:hypothetical protein Slala01_20180 [Streptomyces lavendulae subsp. lavendulae]GLX28701.1 hypothetical protein Slala02_45210 [Streptomyces lavendulae subsp. lavendulae]
MNGQVLDAVRGAQARAGSLAQIVGDFRRGDRPQTGMDEVHGSTVPRDGLPYTQTGVASTGLGRISPDPRKL